MATQVFDDGTNFDGLLDLCLSSLRRGHAGLGFGVWGSYMPQGATASQSQAHTSSRLRSRTHYVPI